jgi:hypothetical protein
MNTNARIKDILWQIYKHLKDQSKVIFENNLMIYKALLLLHFYFLLLLSNNQRNKVVWKRSQGKSPVAESITDEPLIFFLKVDSEGFQPGLNQPIITNFLQKLKKT